MIVIYEVGLKTGETIKCNILTFVKKEKPGSQNKMIREVCLGKAQEVADSTLIQHQLGHTDNQYLRILNRGIKQNLMLDKVKDITAIELGYIH